MKLQWTGNALGDLARLHDFLAEVNPAAAAKAIQSLVAAPERLVEFPRLGERIERYAPRDVRRIVVGRYELRYEVTDTVITVLRLWHTRESR